MDLEIITKIAVDLNNQLINFVANKALLLL